MHRLDAQKRLVQVLRLAQEPFRLEHRALEEHDTRRVGEARRQARQAQVRKLVLAELRRGEADLLEKRPVVVAERRQLVVFQNPLAVAHNIVGIALQRSA